MSSMSPEELKVQAETGNILIFCFLGGPEITSKLQISRVQRSSCKIRGKASGTFLIKTGKHAVHQF